MESTFRRLYEELMAMVREGIAAAAIVSRIQGAIPDSESRKPLVGHLRDSRNAFEAEGNDEAAGTLERVIQALEEPDAT